MHPFNAGAHVNVSQAHTPAGLLSHWSGIMFHRRLVGQQHRGSSESSQLRIFKSKLLLLGMVYSQTLLNYAHDNVAQGQEIY